MQRPQAPTGYAPEWLMGASAAAFTLLWFLNAIGKLPGMPSPGPRHSGFTDEDRKHLDEVRRTVMREDQMGPGWPIVFNSPSEMRTFRDGVAAMRTLLEECLHERRVHAEQHAALEALLGNLEQTMRSGTHTQHTRAEHHEGQGNT